MKLKPAPIFWDCTDEQYDALVAERADLYAALEEIMCWTGAGMSAEEAGAKCETLGDACDKAHAALASARGDEVQT